MKTHFLLILLLCLAITGFSRPAEIILIRHAEPLNLTNYSSLSFKGFLRAQQLGRILTTDPQFTQNGLPSALFALSPAAREGTVSLQTLTPLSVRLHLPVYRPYTGNYSTFLAHRLLTNPEYDGKTVVVCWNNQNLPTLLSALGIRQYLPHLKPAIFDRVYVITYPQGTPTLQDLPQRVLPGDAIH